MAIYLAERNGQHELTQNDWTELQNYDYRIYQALSDMYPK